MARILYPAKRIVRAPIVWWGRRHYPEATEQQRASMERHLYRRKARQLWSWSAADPHYIYRADLDADSVALDVGAFRGAVADELFDLYGCHIHSFEPEPRFFADLEARAAANPRIHPHPYGLGKADATLTMSLDGPASTIHGGTAFDRGDRATAEVAIRDVATVLDELSVERIDYMKINIEGAEFDLLDRLHESGWLARTRYLLIQFHEWHDRAEQRRWRSRRQLRQHHFEVWNHPWIYELWCHKDQPPLVSQLSKADIAEIQRTMRADYAAAQASGDSGAETDGTRGSG